MIGSLAYFIRSHLARRLLRRYGAAPADLVDLAVWLDFLESEDLGLVHKSYESECCQPGSLAECPEALLKLWKRTLDEACYAWKMIYMLGDEEDEEERAAVWDALCLLLKGVFYLANDIPLKALKMQDPHDFLAHAAAFALPLLLQETTEEGISDVHLRRVFLSVMETKQARNQLARAGPVQGWFPLHIAAANQCSSSSKVAETRDLPSRINPPKTKPLPVEIFDKIVSSSPSIAASSKDSQGNYPLHIACTSGYSWVRGLEDLFRLAPDVARSQQHPNLFVLMAQGAQTNGEQNEPRKKKRGARKLLRGLDCFKNSKAQRMQREKEQDLDRLNTVFQLFQTDPDVVLSLLR